MPKIPPRKCKACKGTGKSSKGFKCVPCKGTGQKAKMGEDSQPLTHNQVGFPSTALISLEASPRITIEQVVEFLSLIQKYHKQCGKGSPYKSPPAIVLAIWSGSLTKYLVNGCEVEDTIIALRKAVSK